MSFVSLCKLKHMILNLSVQINSLHKMHKVLHLAVHVGFFFSIVLVYLGVNYLKIQPGSRDSVGKHQISDITEVFPGQGICSKSWAKQQILILQFLICLSR